MNIVTLNTIPRIYMVAEKQNLKNSIISGYEARVVKGVCVRCTEDVLVRVNKKI